MKEIDDKGISRKRVNLRRAAVLGSAAGTTGTAAIVAWYGVAQIGAAVVEGIAAVPAALIIHLGQVYLSARAWRSVVPEPTPSVSLMFEARWIRESVNSLLPVANIGGGIVGARLLVRHPGLGAAAAGASLTVDVTIEAITQILFVACGAVLAWLISTDDRVPAPGWIWMGLGSAIAVVAVFVVAQRLGLLNAVEAVMRWAFPFWLAGRQGQMHPIMVSIYRRWRALSAGSIWHLLSWSLGAAEVWVLSWAVAHPVSPAAAYCIESLGMTARNAAFMIPAGLAAQEAGFLIVGVLVGLPPSIALAISMLKRVRELAIAIPGVVRWQWIEGHTLFHR